MTTTLTIMINKTGTVRLYGSDNKEIATYVSKKGDDENEFLDFLEGIITNLDYIHIVLPGVMPAVCRMLDCIRVANKFGAQLSTGIYDLDQIPTDQDQLAAQFDQPVECNVKSIL